MRSILAIAFGVLVVSLTIPSAAQPLHFWSQRFGSTSAVDEGKSLVLDGAGNVIVTGQFGGTVDFGGGNLMGSGLWDIFLAKYNASGLHQWSQRFGSTGVDAGVAVVADNSGNVIVTGDFEGTVDFGGGNLVSAGGQDIFVAKYSAGGSHLWSQRFGGAGNDGGNAAAVDGTGNVFVTGAFEGIVDFGGGNVTSAGINDIFIAHYSASGAHQWSQRFGSVGSDVGSALAVDGSGKVALVGYFFGTVDFGGGNLVSAGSFDILVAKYDANGTHVWSQRFGSTGPDFGIGGIVDGPGNVLVTGSFEGTVSFGGASLVSAGVEDVFVAKYNAGGVHQWSQRFGSTGEDVGNAVAIVGPENPVVTGFFSGTVSFGGVNLVSAGNSDIFVAVYDTGGAHQWSQRFGGASFERGHAVAVSSPGNAVLTGRFQGSVDFGGGNLTSAGGTDILLASYGTHAVEPGISSITDIGNDQGRQVKIRFTGSGYDDRASPTGITQYEAYRRDDAAPSTWWRDPVGLSEPELRADGWTQVGAVSAHAEPSYGIDVPTIGDSTITLGQYYSVFYIRAATSVPFTYFDSPIDSGYSVDNLAPAVPVGFAHTAGILSWNESPATDFDYFSIYGSDASAFGSATLVDYTTATNLDVTSSSYAFYFVTATDFSGNEGNPAMINTLSGVGGTPKGYLLSISAFPNPFNPETTVRYTVPARRAVTLAVYDLRGAHVATLVDQELDAGAHTVAWKGLDDRGNRVASGVYFARLVSPEGARSYKMTLLK